MIILKKNTTKTVYLSLAENQSAATQYYLFKFTNRATKKSITKKYENISAATNYQKFSIDGTFYNSENAGFYLYEVYESNSQGAQIGSILETGFMMLENQTDFAPTNYIDQDNTFKTYNG